MSRLNFLMDEHGSFDWSSTTPRQYSDRRLDKIGKLAADSIISDIKRRGLNLSANDYQNSSWALVNVWDYAQTTKNSQLQDTVRRLVKEAYGEKALNCSPAADQTGFLPSCLFRFWLVAKVLPPKRCTKTHQPISSIPDLPVPVLNPKTPHENGLNFSRAWALWDIYWLTMRPEIIDAYADHVRVGINEKSQWAGSYETVGHWVPQFGMFALQPLFGSAKKVVMRLPFVILSIFTALSLNVSGAEVARSFSARDVVKPGLITQKGRSCCLAGPYWLPRCQWTAL